MRRNPLKSRVSVLMLIYMVYSLVFPVHVFALPKGGNVVAGSAGITQPDQLNMQVNQASDKAIINWQQFSIAHQEAVRFLQPGAASIALNRVTGGDLSAIHGLLSANGRIFVINPNGIMVGPTGRIETNSFLGSTLDITNQDFLSGNYVFIQNPGASLASILNQGKISAAGGGSVSLLAPGIVNQGSIIANLGKVNLGAGEKITLNFAGNDLINFVINESVKNKVLGIDGSPLENGVLNEGRITADGGEVVVSAKVAYDAIKSVVNNKGVIEARTLENKNGVIKLSGGDEGITLNSGTLDVFGEDEGETGGYIEVTGKLVGLVEYSNLRASGRLGGGKINIGGGFQGKDAAIKNAEKTYVGKDAVIEADATENGDGGKVVVWSDDTTRFYGSITAKGGEQGGNGGFVEVSGKQHLNFHGIVNTSASNGNTGTLLLDPTDITIVTGTAFSPGAGSSSIASTTTNIGGTGDNIWAIGEDVGLQTIGETDVFDLLQINNTELRASATITASSGVNITWANANSLTFDAGTDITLNDATFSSNAASLNMNFGQGGVSGTLALGSSNLTGMGAVMLTAGDGATNPGNYTISREGGNTWNISAANQGNISGVGALSGALNFTNIGNLTGAAGNDTFTLGAGITTFAGSIAGGGDTDSLITTDGTNAWAVTGANAGTLNTTTIFTTMETLTGGTGTDTVTGTAGADAFTISGANAGGVAGMTFTAMETLDGAAGNDTFTLGAGITTFAGSIAGGGDTDSLITTDGTNAWAVTGANAGTLNTTTIFTTMETLTGGTGTDTVTGTAGADAFTISGANAGGVAGMTFTAMETLDGAAGNDTFTLGAGVTSFAGSIAGSGDTDSLIATDGTNAWLISGANAGTLNADTVFTAMETLTGGTGTDTVTGTAGADAFTIGGANAGGVAGMTFTAMETLDGAAGNDTFTLGAGITTFAGSIAGGLNTDSLIATDGTNAWAVTGANAGTLNTTTIFTTMETLTGGTGTDTVTGTAVADAFTISGANAGGVAGMTFTAMETLDGAAGNDTFTLGAGVTSFAGSIAGSGDTDSLIATDGTNAWLISGANAGTLNADTVFTAMETLTGGTGTDTVTGTAGADAFTIGGANAGGVAGMTFTAMETLDGAAGNDTFTLGAGITTFAGSIAGGGDTDSLITTDGTNAWAVTGANAGTLNTTTIFTTMETLTGGTGTDTVTGTAGADAFTISGANAGGVAGMTFTAMETLDGAAGNDTFTLGAGVTSFAGSIAGSGDTDSLIATDGTNAWLISGANAGTLNADTVFTAMETLTGGTGTDTVTGTAGADAFTIGGANAGGVAGMTFTAMETLDGAAGNDTFTLGAGVTSFAGSIAGGGDTDSLIATDGTNAWLVSGANAGTLNTDTVFTAMETLTGGTGADTVTGTAGADAFTISGANAGGVAGMTFTAMETLDGAAGNDTFTLGAGVTSFAGSIAGSGDTDSLIATDGTNAWLISGANAGTLNADTVFTAMETLTGGTGTDTVTGTAGADAFTIGGANAGGVAGMTFTAMETLDGAAGNDTFTLGAGITTFAGSIAGGLNTDSLIATDGTNAWLVSGANAGTLNTDTVFTAMETLTGGTGTDTVTGTAGADAFTISGANAGGVAGMTFTAMETLDGAAGNDTFTLGAGVTSFAGSIAGSGDTDSLIATDGTNAWLISGANAGTLNADTVFTAMETLTGGTGTDTVTGTAGADAFTISGANAGGVAGMTFTAMETLDGAAGNDTFTLGAGVTSFAGSIAGGGDTDSLITTDGTNAWLVSGANAGTLNSTTLFSAITNLTGGNGDDTFTLGVAGSLSGAINGLGQTLADTLDVTAKAAEIVNLGGTTTSIGSFTNIESITGASTLTGGSVWSITALNSGTVDSVIFSNVSNVTGTGGDDTFTLSGTGRISGTISGGVAGTDTLTGNDIASTWAISAANAGTLTDANGANAFTGIDALVGGTNTDAFTLGAGVTSFAGSIAGSGDTDSLIATDGTNTWLISGANAGTLNTNTVFTTMETLTGGTGADTLTGTAGADAFTISGANAGGVAGMTFTAMETLDGAAGNDTFTLGAGIMTFAGSIAGGLNTDSLIATDGTNAWLVSGANAGTLNTDTVFTAMETLTGGTGADTVTGTAGADAFTIGGANAGGVAGMTFTAMEALDGAAGNDTFTLGAGVTTFSGSIAGGLNTDSLIATDGTNAWLVSGANAGTLNTTTIFTTMETLTGGTGTDTVTGTAGADAFTISGANAGGVAGMTFTAMEALDGAAGNDTFTLGAGVTTFSGSIAGGGNTDSLITTDGTNAWLVSGANAGTLNTDTVFTAMETLTGGTGTDTVTGTAGADAFTISGANAGGVAGMTFTAMETLDGAAGNDTFTLGAGITTFAGSIAGGLNTDSLIATDGTNAWAVTGANAGTLNTTTIFTTVETLTGGTGTDTVTGTAVADAFTISGANAGGVAGMTFTAMDALDGAAGNDTFTLGAGIMTFAGSIAGGGDTDSLITTDGTNAWAVTGANAGTLNTTTIFTTVETLTGGTGADTLTGTAGADAFTISGANAGGVAGMTFTAMETLDGAAGNDTFTLGAGITTFAGSIAGSGDTDSLIATDGTNAWLISGANAGTLNTDTVFATIEILTGGSGNDTFTLGAAGSFSGSINGLGQTTVDTLDVTAKAGEVVNLGGTTTSIGSFTNIESITGASTLSGGSIWNITALNSGTVDSVIFSNVPNVTGTVGNDTFTLSGTGRISGAIDGALGANTLTGNNLASTWTITAPNAGTLTDANGASIFTGIQNLTGGSNTDVFNIQVVSSPLTINAGLGDDTINISSNAPVNTGNLADITSTLNINGDGGSDTLNMGIATAGGTLTGSAITGLGMTGQVNYGTLENMNITLGSGNDTFNVQGIASGTTATLNAGAGNDTINVGNAGSSLDNLFGTLVVNGQGHVTGDILNINDQGDTTANTYNVAAATVTRSGAGNITYGTIETINLYAGSGSGTVNITGSGAGNLSVDGNARINTISVNTNPLNLSGALSLNNAALVSVDQDITAGGVAIGGGIIDINRAVNSTGTFTSAGTTFDNTGGLITSGGALTVNHTGDVTIGAALNTSASGASIDIRSGGNIEMTTVNAGGGSVSLTAAGTLNGGTFTGGSGTVNASTAGLSSLTTANVASLRVNLTSQDATGVSGKFDKGANLTTAPPTDQINGPGTILITGFPAYFPEDVDDPMAELAALSSISGEQAILEMILSLSRETEFFMAPPLMLSIAADEVDASLGEGSEKGQEPCRDDDEECKERMKGKQ